MLQSISLGACPAEEDVAQLGRTPDFGRLNRLEVDCYQAALVAKYGPPPADAYFIKVSWDHDFGRYTELAVNYDREDAAAVTWFTLIEAGLGRWFHAGFTAPVAYPDSTTPVIHHADLDCAIRSAISTMRAPFPDGERMIANLRDHYPHVVPA